MLFLSYQRFSALFILFLFVFLPFQLNAQTAKNKKSEPLSQELSKATYMTAEGGDLDKLIARKATIDGEGKFTINLKGELPKQSAKLSVNAYDIDEERGETVKIYFNGNYAGKLSGTNNTWNTSLLDIKASWLKKGDNLVRFVITDTSKSRTIKWSSKVDWGQLMIDGGAGDKGLIVTQNLKYTEKKGEFKATSNVKVTSKESGDFRLEISILDAKANSVASNIKDFSMKKGEIKKQSIDLKISKSIPVGKYNVLANLFSRQDGLWVQQEYRIVQWENRKEKRIKPILQLVSPIKDIFLKEDALSTKIDLNKVFSVVDANNDNTSLGLEEKISKLIFTNTNKELVSATIKDDQLILDYVPNQYGNASIHVVGNYENQKITDIFNITLTEVDDAPTVSQPINDILVDENSKDTKIDLSRTFYDSDNDREKILKRVKVNGNPSLVTAKISGDKLVLSYAENMHGYADITIEGFSNTQSVETRFKVIVYPVEKEEQKLTSNKDKYYGKVAVSSQKLQSHDNAMALSLGVGRQFDSLLEGLAIELNYSNTINRHEKYASTNDNQTKDYHTAKVDVRRYSLFLVYEFFAQEPGRYSLFKDNPLKTRLKLGYSSINYALSDAPDHYEEDEYLSDTSSLSYGIEIVSGLKSGLESFFEITQITSQMMHIALGARLYY